MSVDKTLQQRGSRYGEMEDNARITCSLMEVISTGASSDKLKPMHIECIHMICGKISRIVNGDVMYSDSAHDIAGYAKLLEDWQIKENETFAKAKKMEVKQDEL